MRVLTCASARRRLQAYHDGELAVADQIDVGAHLDWCDHCAGALADMQLLRAAIRGMAPGRASITVEEGDSLQSSVISCIRAEKTTSLSARVKAMLDDRHMVYAGLGAATATVTCIMIMLSMMRFETSVRSPGSNEHPVVVNARMLLPRAINKVLMTAQTKGGDEAAFTLSAVVTREGRIVNLELHSESGQTLEANSSEAQEMQSLLGEVSRARFEPARVAGLPVAVNMIWLVAHTTVRAAKMPGPLGAPALPLVKKRQVNVPDSSARHNVRLA